MRDENEQYCRERLGVANAHGEVADRLRELAPAPALPELLARPLRQARYLVLDLETTGMRPDRARIIEIGAVEVDGFELGREAASLIYPGSPVPPFIANLTGISTAMLLNQPRLPEVLPIVERMLRGRVLVCHNLSFDYAFLSCAWEQVLGRPLLAPSLCTVKLSRRVFPELPSHNLDAIVSFFKLRATARGVKARHRALGDARLTALALVKMCEKAEQEGMAATLGELIAFQSSRCRRRPRPAPALAPAAPPIKIA